ncbi:MAG: TIM barrel protein [Bacteroidia bacterium]|nr:TIM barrel protein [Bacteroidia bacterium]
MRWYFKSIITLVIMLVATGFMSLSPAQTGENKIRIYDHPMNPRQHPDDSRRWVKPPDAGTFGNRIQFMALRSLEDDYKRSLDLYTIKYGLGDIIWPSWPLIFRNDVTEISRELKKRSLYLFDIWGYVPGSGPGGYWQQFVVPDKALAIFERELGDRWLGMDNGEQDGRYVGGFANQMVPVGGSRETQYLNFQNHFQGLTDRLGNKIATLVSLNFGHYFLKEGVYTMIGAETAQGLPNDQVYYSFIRGAGKQYGVPWFGNASVWNRWGYKNYTGNTEYNGGETEGTSLSLLKRLMYSQIMYDCVAVGFESSFLNKNNELSPIGKIQQSAVQWVKKYGDPGALYTPVAVMVDFFSGWSFPRHLYSGNIYRVWGNLPFESGDYLTDDILDMFYPGYRDASYFHDETGFVARGLAGISTGKNDFNFDANATVACNKTDLKEPSAFTVKELVLPPGAKTIASCGNSPLVVEQGVGSGKITVFASPFGLSQKPTELPTSSIDMALKTPFPLLKHVKAILGEIFSRTEIFEAGEDLSLITCRKGTGDFTIAVTNNSWLEKPFLVTSKVGKIEKMTELPLDCSEQKAIGFQPKSVLTKAGRNTNKTIAGGDIRIFSIKMEEENIEEVPFIRPEPNPVNRGLNLRNIVSVKEEILLRPTFFQHFDRIQIDWKYLQQKETPILANEAGWIKRQGLKIIVDFSSGLNLFPDLRLVKNDTLEYDRSMEIIKSVIDKMAILGVNDLILTTHRGIENNYTGEQFNESMNQTIRELCRYAAKQDINVNLKMTSGRNSNNLEKTAALVQSVGEPNLFVAPSTALILSSFDQLGKDLALLKGMKYRIVFVAALEKDLYGSLWNVNGRVTGYPDLQSFKMLLSANPESALILDGIYNSQDEEYLDASAVETNLKKQ